jgi:hypothetical protein
MNEVNVEQKNFSTKHLNHRSTQASRLFELYFFMELLFLNMWEYFINMFVKKIKN